MDLKESIRSIPGFPKEGIVFKDITTLLQDSEKLKEAVDALYDLAKDKGITKVVGIESRGFIMGAMLAYKLGAGFVPVRKPGKLPYEKLAETYSLEYGEDQVEIHTDAIEKGDIVLMHDDLLATGGTMEAACKLVEKLGGKIEQISFLIELTFIKGRGKLQNYDVKSLVEFDSE